jgi:hypothetical protein
MYSLWYNVNRGFRETYSARHLKTLPDRGEKKLTTYFNSAQNMLLGLPTLFLLTKNKNSFVIQCYLYSLPPKLRHRWFQHHDVNCNDVEANFPIKTSKWDGGCRQYVLTKKTCICIVLYKMILRDVRLECQHGGFTAW